MLDDETLKDDGSDAKLAQSYNDKFLGKHEHFGKPKTTKGKDGDGHFALKHYAGNVRGGRSCVVTAVPDG